MSQNSQVITIDGPAGAGKSTVAKSLAKRLNLSYLDTGAMYRALTLKAIRDSADLENEEQLVKLANGTTIDLKPGADAVEVFLDGVNVSEEIRSVEVTNNTHYIARAAEVREIMVKWQRDIGERRGAVVEGRDVGTVVFPNAHFKFYLDANVSERCMRRLNELRESGKDIDADKLMKEIQERDQKDLTRDVSPLKKAEDAVLIDSTDLSAEDVVEQILNVIKTADGKV